MTWTELPNPQSGKMTSHEGTHPFLGMIVLESIQHGLIYWPFIPQRTRLWLVDRSFVWFGYKQWEGGWRIWDFENWSRQDRDGRYKEQLEQAAD